MNSWLKELEDLWNYMCNLESPKKLTETYLEIDEMDSECVISKKQNKELKIEV